MKKQSKSKAGKKFNKLQSLTDKAAAKARKLQPPVITTANKFWELALSNLGSQGSMYDGLFTKEYSYPLTSRRNAKHQKWKCRRGNNKRKQK